MNTQEATLAAAGEALGGEGAAAPALGTDRLALAVRFLLVTGVYIGAAKLGIALRVAHGVITPVWAPTGLAIACVFLFGPRMWPAVAIGALVTNATSGVSVLTAAGIAVGNTFEALAGSYLLHRARVDAALDRARDVLALVLLASLVATTISATIGTLTLLLSGDIAGQSYGSNWLLWWFGDLIGALLVTPLLLVWSRGRALDRQPARLAEAALLLTLLGVAGWIVFFGGRWQYPYVLFPLLVWAALRFGQRGAVTAIFVVATLGIWGSVNGAVAIEAASTTQTVQILQALIAVVAVAVMTMAAAIEEQAVATEELAAAVEKQRRAEDVKAKFLSMATHEMSTPLAVASGYADLLLGDWNSMGDAEKRQAIGRIAEQTRRLARLVEGLLATSRADAGQLAVRSQALDLTHVVTQVLQDIATDSVTVKGTASVVVMADRDHVEQILMNYLSNALKYGAPPFSVELTASDGFGIVRVCDGGQGVAEDFVPRLFERFSRGPMILERGISGTGLGLSIVQDLARAQGGEAWYEPNPPSGACFCVRLPLAAVS